MAAGATYEPIASQTLVSAASSITFSSIAASWTDLRWVLVGTLSGINDIIVRFNSDSGNNYSWTGLYGDGSVGSNRQSNVSGIRSSEGNPSLTIPFLNTGDIFSYAGSTYKTQLTSYSNDTNSASSIVRNAVGLWRSTAAITSVTILPASGADFNTGTTATLYGIKNA